jgi:hypothetical protein
MANETSPYVRPKASLTKTIILAVIVVVALILAVIAFNRLNSSNYDDSNMNPSSTGTNQQSVPADDVKQDTGPNSDTTPSSDGAGSANTLQNQ